MFTETEGKKGTQALIPLACKSTLWGGDGVGGGGWRVAGGCNRHLITTIIPLREMATTAAKTFSAVCATSSLWFGAGFVEVTC